MDILLYKRISKEYGDDRHDHISNCTGSTSIQVHHDKLHLIYLIIFTTSQLRKNAENEQGRMIERVVGFHSCFSSLILW